MLHTKRTVLSIPALGANAGPILALAVFQTARIAQTSHALLATPTFVADTLAAFAVAISSAVEIASFYK